MSLKIMVDKLVAFRSIGDAPEMLSISGVCRGTNTVSGILCDGEEDMPFEAQATYREGAAFGTWADTVTPGLGSRPCVCGRSLFLVQCKGHGQQGYTAGQVAHEAGCGADRCRDILLLKTNRATQISAHLGIHEVQASFDMLPVPGRNGTFLTQPKVKGITQAGRNAAGKSAPKWQAPRPLRDHRLVAWAGRLALQYI